MPIFTYAVVAFTVIVSLIGFSNDKLFQKGSFSIAALNEKREYHRLFTSQLLHVNFVHLAFNMISFYSFSESLEIRYGLKIVAVIYLYSGIGGDLLAWAIRRKQPTYQAVGASGAVSGIIFASVFLQPEASMIIFPLPVPLPSWLFAILFMLVSLYGIGRGHSNIGHEAHLGGALTGIIWALLYNPQIVSEHTLLLSGLTIPVLIMLTLFLVKPNLIAKKISSGGE